MTYNDININSINDWADFWYYQIGVNVIPADTENKETYESWSQWQDKPIPDELHEQWKRNGEYNKGIAIVTGKIWRGKSKDQYLIGIDCDNKKAIEEICTKDGKTISVQELAKWTIVEQHIDNPNKAHIYIMSTRPFKNKSSTAINLGVDKKIDDTDIPAIEIKCEKHIMFCTPSIHKDGYPYEILDCKEPAMCDEFEYHLNNIYKNYGKPYLESNNHTDNNYSYSSLIPIDELFKPETIIYKGQNRHEAVLRISESLLQRNKKILSLEKIKQIAIEWNQEHCVPPLNDIEFEKQFHCSLKFISRVNEEVNSNYNNNEEKEQKVSSSNKSSAEILDKLTKNNIHLFKNQYGNPHAIIKVNDHKEILSVESSRFERYLSKLYYDNNNNENSIISKESLSNVIRKLQAEAEFEGKTIPLQLRVAWSDTKDSIYYDLTDARWRCIEITKNEGWKIIDNHTNNNNNNNILFTRYNQKAQVEPVRDYDAKALDKFIDSANIKNEKHTLLLKVYIISLLIPGISHPILLPHGEQGSAKSTLQNKIKLLIDPSEPELLTIHNDKTEFIQQLSHNYLAFYDNVRYEPRWLSDEACKAVTGIGFTKRKHYTNDEDFVYKFKRCLSFSGINVIFTEPDARDRSITIELDGIADEYKIPEEKIYSDFNQQLPQLLGYMFDIVSKALRIKDDIVIKKITKNGRFCFMG